MVGDVGWEEVLRMFWSFTERWMECSFEVVFVGKSNSW